MIRKREQEVEFHLKAHEPTISNGASECFLAASLFLGQSRNFMNIFKFVANDFTPNFSKKKKEEKIPTLYGSYSSLSSWQRNYLQGCKNVRI